jgi:hypothetical protein
MGHEPDWECVGEERLEPCPDFFGLKKTYWFTRCCGKGMRMMKMVQARRCKICGRQEERVVNWYLACCVCCGRTKEMLKGGPWD